MQARCQCGLITFTTPAPLPSHLYICHCNECRRQSASLFSTTAVFPAFTIPSPHPGAIGLYTRTTLSGKQLDCYSCARCGSRLMSKVEGQDTLNVKGGVLEDPERKLDWGRVTHIWCKEAVGPVPEGVRRFEEEPVE